MFKIGDLMMYGKTGVCKVTQIKSGEAVGNPDINYYVLEPVFSNNTTIMIPTNNTRVLMRRLATKDEVLSLIDSIPETETSWIDNDRMRGQEFKEILNCGNCAEWISVIKSLIQKDAERTDIGKKLHLADSAVLKDVQRLLYEEFAIALEIPTEKVQPFIETRLTI